jgi:acetoin utilization deacetylase AcuC-like enzyme
MDPDSMNPENETPELPLPTEAVLKDGAEISAPISSTDDAESVLSDTVEPPPVESEAQTAMALFQAEVEPTDTKESTGLESATDDAQAEPTEIANVTEVLLQQEATVEAPETPSPAVKAQLPPAPSRPPAPPVFFVWHPQMNEEREENEVLPSERWRESYHLLEVTGALHWREVKIHTPDLHLGRPEAVMQYHTKTYCDTVLAVSEGRANLWSNGKTVHLPMLTHAATPAAQNVAAARSAIKVALNHPKVRVLTPAGQQPRAHHDRLEDGHLFNDVLMALEDAQSAGVKTAFINLDAEHPTPVQERFYGEPLLTISLHEHPSFLYPHTGTVRETGKGKGAGYHLNIPMPPSISDAGYLLVLEQIILPMLARYQPELLVVVGGVTAHVNDPASHLCLTSKGYQLLIAKLMDTAPRMVLFGGDATHFATAARLWTIALATLAERTNSLPPQIPAAHARLWGGGTFHDTEPLLRSAPYQEYAYALLAHELEQAHTLLKGQWELPDLHLPPRLSDQREQLQVARPTGEVIANYTSKEPSLGMSFAGLNASLGDDEDDDELASRRNPHATSRSVSKWEQDEEETAKVPSKPERPRGRREEPPASNPLGGGDKRGGVDSFERRNNFDRGRGTSNREHNAPSEKRDSSTPDTPTGNRGGRNDRRDNKPAINTQAEVKSQQGNRERRDHNRPSRSKMPRNPSDTPTNENDHSATPPRGSARTDDHRKSSNSFRGRGRGGKVQGESPTSSTPPSDGNNDPSKSGTARRHRPRPRR